MATAAPEAKLLERVLWIGAIELRNARLSVTRTTLGEEQSENVTEKRRTSLINPVAMAATAGAATGAAVKSARKSVQAYRFGDLTQIALHRAAVRVVNTMGAVERLRLNGLHANTSNVLRQLAFSALNLLRKLRIVLLSGYLVKKARQGMAQRLQA